MTAYYTATIHVGPKAVGSPYETATCKSLAQAARAAALLEFDARERGSVKLAIVYRVEPSGASYRQHFVPREEWQGYAPRWDWTYNRQGRRVKICIPAEARGRTLALGRDR